MLGKAILITILFLPILFISKLTGEKELPFFLFYCCSMGVYFLIFHRNRQRATGISCYFIGRMPIACSLVIIVLTISLANGLIYPIISLIPMPEMMKKLFAEWGQQQGIFSFLTIVVAAPVLEEFIFRGIILDGLLRRYSPAKAILVSAFLFGLFHFNPWQFCGAFLIGIFSGWIYYRSRNLLPCILIHFTNNLFAEITSRFLQSSADIDQSLTQYYGGTFNMVLIIIALNLLTIRGIYYLYASMERTICSD